MKKFTNLHSIVTPFIEDDVNTDQIIPSEYLKDINADLSFGLFAYLRRDAYGVSQSSFVLERSEFLNSKILLVGKNFGCGSSREHAVWALQEFGFECIIALSFSDLFKNNCLKNGILTIELEDNIFYKYKNMFGNYLEPKSLKVDLPNQSLCDTDGILLSEFHIDSNIKSMLIDGLDEIDLTLNEMVEITKWELGNNNYKKLLQKSIA
jgi:3-isopropylmalate dehydratase small subunit